MRFLTICFGIILSLGSGAALSVSQAESLISTSHGLDLSIAHLVVDVPHEYYERFYERAQGHFVQAGLSTNSATKYKQGEPILRLTLEVKPLDETCSEHFLYTNKLEVQESVVTERTPKVRVWAVTWSLGTGSPEVRNKRITIEEMEKNIGSLMKTFLLDYQYANQ